MDNFDPHRWYNQQRAKTYLNENKSKHDVYLDIVMKWLDGIPQANAVKNYLESNRGLITRDMMSSDFDAMNEQSEGGVEQIMKTLQSEYPDLYFQLDADRDRIKVRSVSQNDLFNFYKDNEDRDFGPGHQLFATDDDDQGLIVSIIPTKS